MGEIAVTTNLSPKTLANTHDKVKAQKELVGQLKVEWKLLWSECFNDRVRAEDISVKDYESLLIERGTIIQATRNFKVLTFKGILEEYMIESPDRFLQPDVTVGGWHKFIKTQITSQKPLKGKRADSYVPEKREIQQSKKGGRGWLHTV
jgi:hypothetical protein